MESVESPEPMDRLRRVRQFITDELLFGDDRLSESTNILGLLDSQALMQLVTFIEEDLEIQIDEQDLAPENFRTMGDIERFLNERARDS
jgi:acyl carrier protein